MRKKLRWQSYAVILALAVGIVIPSAFLSYLGLRSFHYERALLQKQTEERYADVGEALHARANEILEGFTTPLEALADSPAFADQDTESAVSQWLSGKKLNRIPIRALWAVDRNEQLSVPIRFSSPTAAQPRVLNWGALTAAMQELERLEISDGNTAQALQGYEAINRKNLPPVLQAALLKMIAAANRKLGKLDAAEENYTELERNYEQVPDPTGLPTGLVARQLLGEFYRTTHQDAKAADAFLGLYQALIFQRWPMSSADREQWIHRVGDLLQRLRGSPAWTEALDARRRQLDGYLERLNAVVPDAKRFADVGWPRALKRLRERGTLERGDVLRSETARWWIVAPIKKAATGERRGSLIAVVNASDVEAVLQKAFDELARPAGLFVDASLQKQNGFSPPAGAAAVLRRAVNRIDPPIPLTLWRPRSTTEETFTQRRVRIYTLVSAVSLLVLLTGLATLILAIRKEVGIATLKSEFVSNLSHQIRTPLYAIMHISERLELGRYRSDEELKSFYRMLREEVERLRDLADHGLNFSKLMNAGKRYHAAREDLRAVLTDARDAFAPKAASHGFTIVMESYKSPIWVRVDRKALMQALLNLLDNAVKYSDRPGTIHMAAKIQSSRAFASVTDEGIGIPTSEQTKIFDKFYQVNQTKAGASDGGVGLGLAIVQQIVEGHGGRITVESKPGEGSTFTIELPDAQTLETVEKIS